MRNVSFNIRLFFVLMFTLLSFQSLQASHAVGMDISVIWAGPGNLDYEIKVSFYRDCVSSASAPSNLDVWYQSASCGVTGCGTSNSNYISIPRVSMGEITPICPFDNTTCTDPLSPNMGVEEFTYTQAITLPNACADWRFSTSINARNAAISTINNPGGETIFIEATLNNLDFPKNSTPLFTNVPVPFICVNQPFLYNHGAIDPDGDALIYSLVTPKVSLGPPGFFLPPVVGGSGNHDCNSNGVVSYKAGYSAASPLISTPPVSIDPATGNVFMNPTQTDITVVAVLVEEFRNGVKCGSVLRDIQIVALPCSNNLPELSGIDNTNVFADTLCAGETLCFDVFSSDLDNTQNLTLTWNQSISGASFNSTVTQFPVGTFCWTPAMTDTSVIPHYFTIEVEDDNCPYFGFQTYSYSILVTPGIDLDLGLDDSIYCGDSMTITAASTSPGPFTYQWNTGSTLDTIHAKGGNYKVTIDDGSGCFGLDSIYVDHIDKPIAGFDIQALCTGDSAYFTDTSMFLNMPYSWSWDFGDGSANASNQNVGHVYTSGGSFDIKLIVYDNKACVDSIVKTIFILDTPIANFSVDTVCEGLTTTFNDLSAFTMSTIASWSWDFGDGNISLLQSPTNIYAQAGTYNTVLEITDLKGCKDSLIKQVLVNPGPLVGLTASSPCEGDSTYFYDLTTVSGAILTSWNWDFGDPASGAANTSSQQNNSHFYSTYGTYNVVLNVTDADGCIGIDSITSKVHQKPVADYIFSDTCVNQALNFIDKSSAGSGSVVSWVWNFGDGTTGSTPSPSHAYTVPGQYTCSLIVANQNHCKDTVFYQITVDSLPIVALGVDVPQGCVSHSVNFSDLSNDAVQWAWDFGDGSTSALQAPAHTYTVPGTYDVTLNVVSSLGCVNFLTTTAMVKVFSLPIADFIPNPQKSSISDMFHFNNTSFNAVSWSWDFGDGNVSNEEFPSHLYSDTGWHQIQLITISPNGCYDTTFNTVYVAPNFSLFYPNAFTPNSDLLNDDFGGIGQYEGIKEFEFLIYNRWGELVFQTFDPYVFWDGTKNNMGGELSQDGAYIYIAKVRDYLERSFDYKGVIMLLK